jgi:GT2 family glycosyltransferase
MKISAIIVNWNGKEETLACIASLLKQDSADLEIIVSDNGSTDGSIEQIQETYPSVILIQNDENLGFGTAVNRGFQVATGEGLLFLNNDLVLETDCVSQLIQVLESDVAIGAVVPKILYTQEPDKINSFGVLINYTGIAYPHLLGQNTRQAEQAIETACGGIFLFRKSLYEAIGGFDEDLFLYHEDHDLSWRIRLAGWKLIVTPNARMHHLYKFNKGVRKFYFSEKNRLLLLLANMEIATLIAISPALILVEAAQWVHALLNGWASLKLKSYFEIAEMLTKITQKRRRIRLLRKVPDKEIVRLYQGKLAVSGVDSVLMKYGLSPLLNLWWKLVKNFI